MSDFILTCNAGSNSLKCALFRVADLSPAYRFEADRIHRDTTMSIEGASGETLVEAESIESGYASALHSFLTWQREQADEGEVIACGHRIVHGGREFEGPVDITPPVRKRLEALVPLAPLHQPHNLKLIDLVREERPKLPQVACFDTAFHRSQPWVAQQFALPRELSEQEHILRYGFHGLSYEYLAQQLPDYLEAAKSQRVIAAHLGGGTSLCAMQDGKSIATTMGFTALDGLMMGTRCGDLDPGVVLYLLKQKNMSAEEIETLLYKESGLLGVSGISGDMRDLDDKDDERARQAVELFCYMAARQLGGLIPALGGLDALVFSGGMGAGDFLIRAKICDYLKWLDVQIDEIANARHKSVISTPESAVTVLTIPTDEEYVIASQTARIATANTGGTHGYRKETESATG